MNGKVNARNPALYISLMASLFLFALGFSLSAEAAPQQLMTQTASQNAEKAHIQLARNGHHHHHRHWRGGYRGYRVYGPGVYIGPGLYYGPRYRGGYYWTGWRTYYRHGHRCVKRCMVNRWNGRVIRCNRRCFY